MLRASTFYVVAETFLLLLVAARVLPQSPSNEKALWFWSAECPRPKVMRVEVAVDGRTVYRSSFRACHIERSAQTTEVQRKTMYRFHFSGGHTFQGEYHTSKSDSVGASIWEAGADPNDILLGIGFMAHHRVLLNTIHIVKPGQTTQSTLDRGIVIKTYPGE